MDTARLRELVTADGPFASVYFEDTHDTEDAGKQLELKWRDLREQLSEQGAGEATLAALETAVFDSEPPVGVSGRALIAAGDRVLLDQRLGDAPARALARVSTMPNLVPLVEYGELPPPHVVVVADSVGADITAVDELGRVVDARTVEGTEHHVHKPRGGAWAHRTIQNHAEELVKQNIELAADHVGTVGRRIGASLVVAAGAPEARKALIEALPETVREHATEVSGGGRHQGSGEDTLNAEIDDLLTEATRRRRQDAADRFSAALSKPTGLAVQGIEAVTTALREHNVETLLVGDPGDAEVFAGSGDPAQLAAQAETLTTLGVDRPGRVRADEALPVAAASVDADIVHVGERVDLTEGFGAILRHD
ncbi:Rv2629 family ribosome hibernation factor [Saccharomonospora saliphila]|uniref:Rv2629 family ribosome hibernation factor n=1 Tax=Saccharomonospora saliphila TaxID=369829 RepID=UPI00037B15C7|nr:hypothetical protein [Saccharomonospora saliphila]